MRPGRETSDVVLRSLRLRERLKKSSLVVEEGNVRARVARVGDSLVWTAVNVWSGKLMGARVCPYHYFDAFSRSELEVHLMSFLRKASTPSMAAAKDCHADPTSLVKDHPALAEFLTSAKSPEGERRKGSCMILFCEDGLFKICLSDDDTQLCLWGSGASFWEALDTLEGRLQDPGADWRRKKEYKPKRS